MSPRLIAWRNNVCTPILATSQDFSYGIFECVHAPFEDFPHGISDHAHVPFQGFSHGMLGHIHAPFQDLRFAVPDSVPSTCPYSLHSRHGRMHVLSHRSWRDKSGWLHVLCHHLQYSVPGGVQSCILCIGCLAHPDEPSFYGTYPTASLPHTCCIAFPHSSSPLGSPSLLSERGSGGEVLPSPAYGGFSHELR